MADIAKCWECVQSQPEQLGAYRWGCQWTSTAQGNRPSGCQTWSNCFVNCNPTGSVVDGNAVIGGIRSSSPVRKDNANVSEDYSDDTNY